MKCPDGKTLIAHATEALDPRRSDWISKHLKACDDCRSRCDEFKADEALLRDALAPRLDFDAITQAVWEKIQRARDNLEP
ncbi:MAG: hypothetical protein V3W41_10110 [Planctomycetota bacterium]